MWLFDELRFVFVLLIPIMFVAAGRCLGGEVARDDAIEMQILCVVFVPMHILAC